MGHDAYSAGVLLLCAIHVLFCAVASFCMPITTLWCYSTVICARLFDTVIFSGFYFIYGLTGHLTRNIMSMPQYCTKNIFLTSLNICFYQYIDFDSF